MLGRLPLTSLQRVQEINLIDYPWQGVFVFLKVRLLPSPSAHPTVSPCVGPTFASRPSYSLCTTLTLGIHLLPSLNSHSLHFADTELIRFSSFFFGAPSFSSTHPPSVFPLSTSNCFERSSPVEIASGTTTPQPRPDLVNPIVFDCFTAIHQTPQYIHTPHPDISPRTPGRQFLLCPGHFH